MYTYEVWGWLIYATFVFVVKMPMYVCPQSSWWAAERNFEMLLPLVRALSLEILFVCLLFVVWLGKGYIVWHQGFWVSPWRIHLSYRILHVVFKRIQGHCW